MTYSFGVPGPSVWISHIIIGLILAYVGYQLINHEEPNRYIAFFLFGIGILATAYHTHLFYYNRKLVM